MKMISRERAIDLAVNPMAKIYMLIPIASDTTIEQITSADAFCYEEPAKEQLTRKNAVDHGKICALYEASWQIKAIADECKCVPSTVINHLISEGIYKNKED